MATTRPKMKVHYSSQSNDWSTPQDFFARLDREFSFEVDVCALPHNAKCARFYTPEEDGLAQDWRGVCFMNPPYGRGIDRWVAKAYESARRGATVVCLLPARTDTAWWHDYAAKGEVRFVRGRLDFGGAKTSSGSHNAPFPCAVVVFRPEATVVPFPTMLARAEAV